MTTALLDLSDCNVQLWHAGNRLQSPGYALLEGSGYVFGLRARAAARLRPRDINTRFWWQLGTDALQPALGPARHTADLAHAHLNALHREGGEPDEILFAVPATMQRDQLSLLLGIAQQCRFNPVGLVNRSVLLASAYGGYSKIYHLELQLHQSAVVTLTQDNGRCTLQRTQALPGCGLLQLQERLVEAVANAFVRQARFDPRRRAETEQQLYDALPGLLSTLAREPECNIDVGGYQARISRPDLAQCAMRLEDSASQAIGQPAAGETILLDPILGLLPGLADSLESTQMLAADDAQRVLSTHEESLVQRDEALDFINELPLIETEANRSTPEPATDAAPAPASAPTHWLQAHRALPLDPAGTELAQGWQLYRENGNWQLTGKGTPPRVNGQNYHSGQCLAVGDEIDIAPHFSARLIEVEA